MDPVPTKGPGTEGKEGAHQGQGEGGGGQPATVERGYPEFTSML